MGNNGGRIALGVATGGMSELWKASAEGAVKGIDDLSGAKDAREAAKDAANKQLQAQDKLQADAKLKAENDLAAAKETTAQRAARAKFKSASGNNRGGTLLTGPSGVTVPTIGTSYTGKTLLGS